MAAAAATKIPHVARVYTRDQLLLGNVPNDRIGSRVLRGFNAQRSGDLEIILEPYWIRQAQGTTHGTPYNYDAHIPLILMGRGVAPGEYSESGGAQRSGADARDAARDRDPGGIVGPRAFRGAATRCACAGADSQNAIGPPFRLR